MEITKTSCNKMNKTNDSKIKSEILNVTNKIENIISPEQIVTQVVSLARDSIDITRKLSSTDNQKIDSVIHNEYTENNIASTSTPVIDELSSKPIRKHSLNGDRGEDPKPNSKESIKHKGSRRKNKQMKENALLEVTNNIITKKGILKKEDLENEEAAFYLATGLNGTEGEIPLQLTDPENIFNENIEIKSVNNVKLKNGTATAYIFDAKRKKNVRFNDNVIIIYYTSSECQQQAIRNGTFITSVVEPLKVALQQQQRNRELRNKHLYMHTIFPSAVRCGKS